MIELYYWPTPNGWKISIALEEMALPYTVVPINIHRGEQFAADFVAISPSSRMPAIIDDDPVGGGEPFALAESGVILRYLAEKSQRFLPTAPRARYRAEQWLMWQMSQLGPMLGQHGHFALYATEKLPYAIDRYRNEVLRLYKELDTQLAEQDYICGDYSIVDMAVWPWILTYKSQRVALDDFANVKRWYDSLKSRPALRRGYDVLKDARSKRGDEAPDDEGRKHLFATKRDE